MGLMPFFYFWSLALSKFDEKLTEMLTPPIEALGFELPGIEFIRAGKHSTLCIYIDGPDGVTADSCAM